ncbi:hypothetical protein B0H63DRAFT_418998 [Podospora didyma]|uniref:Uncharacterized protein n=1 Tax=Podospora didyma TaxID=330526 RepID=A0AAE0KEN3_9PEZI|nr:hypothetical protein B0H63DRAFT_418998 [Podospora didyma]
MSAQNPSGPAQPPKAATYALKPQGLARNLSEYAVADTPGTSAENGGTDYMDCRSHRNPPPTSSATEEGSGVHGGGPANAREARETHYASAGGREQEPQNENEDADKMAPSGEGEVADAVERSSAGRRGTNMNDGIKRPHGRTRGEFSLDGDEGDFERKKAQQSIRREQVKEARRHGEDVDGRGEGEFGGRQPQAEV